MKFKGTLVYLSIKLLKMLVTVLVVATIIFFLVRLMPSNPVQRYIEEQMTQYGLTYEDARSRAAALFSMDLDQPVFQQYLEYIGKVARLDFGNSLLSPGVPVMSIIAARLPWTLFTVGIGLVFSFIIGVIIGAIMAFKRDKWYEPIVTGFVSFLSAIPDFLIAILLLLIFGVIRWNGATTILNISLLRGTYSMNVTPGWNFAFIQNIFMHGLVPILTYMLSQVGIWILLMKGATTSCLSADYVTMARIMGLRPGKVLSAYIARNAMLPIVTEFAMRLGFVVGGALIIEQLFVYQGIGLELLRATSGRDYPLMQGIFLIMSITIVICNFLAEVMYVVLDPRIKSNAEQSNG
jgi:peptide/nickel transport system permease protein